MKSFFQLVNEIHKHQLDEIPLPKNKPFDNIFGKKDRIVIPAKEDNRIKDFEQKLAKHGYKPNYKDNVVEKKVNTQKGSKIVKKAMGKAIAEFAPKLLNWYSDNKSNLEKNVKELKNNNLSIVISRNSVDVARMSDCGGITSCHAPHREDFPAASMEATYGGFIAYLVKTKDLEKADVNGEEIFADDDRKLNGIHPLARLRIRRFTNKKTSHDIAIPEDNTYGNRQVFPDFMQMVLDWIRKIQNITSRPNMGDYVLRGGYYRDSRDSTLWNQFFGDDKDKGDTEYGLENQELSDPRREESDTIAVWQREITAIENEYRNKFDERIIKHSYELEEHPFADGLLTFKATIKYEIPIKDLKNTKDIEYEETLKTLANSVKAAFDIESKYRIRMLIKDKDSTPDQMPFTLELKSPEEEQNPDDYKDFLSQLENLQIDYQENLQKLRLILYHEGYLHEPSLHVFGKKMHNDEKLEKLDNFYVSFDNGEGKTEEEPDRNLRKIEITSLSINLQNVANKIPEKAFSGKLRIINQELVKTLMSSVKTLHINFSQQPQLFGRTINKNILKSVPEIVIYGHSGSFSIRVKFFLNLGNNLKQIRDTYKNVHLLDKNWKFISEKLKTRFLQIVQQIEKEFNVSWNSKNQFQQSPEAKLNLFKTMQKYRPNQEKDLLTDVD